MPTGVRLFATSVGFLTESSRMIDFSPDFLDAACRNFAGQPFVVPWLWDHKYKGQSAWWWCTNSPLYRKYLAMRLAEVAKARPDGLHIDDYRGTSGAVTWRSACFCRHCMAGFREYLAKAVPKEKLAALGISDLDGFDYRQFLLDRGVKPEDYQKRRASLPLAAEFLDFQVKADTAFVADYRRRAEELVGHPLSLCVNSGLNDAQSLAIAPHLSYFCCEVDHAASSRALPKHPAYVYKLADGLDRPVAATASGQDWAYVAEHKLPGLVRMWIALSYAHGQNFMAPHHQWCYTEEKGTHWYSGPAAAVRLALPVRSAAAPGCSTATRPWPRWRWFTTMPHDARGVGTSSRSAPPWPNGTHHSRWSWRATTGSTTGWMPAAWTASGP